MKEIFKSWRVIILLIFLFFSLLTIQPHFFGNEGVTIRSVVANSSASNAGIENPSSTTSPLSKEKIISINGKKINTEIEYFSAISNIVGNDTLRIETDNGVYTLLTRDSGDLGLRVYNSPSSNLRKGLDLEGGIRVLLQPRGKLSNDDLDITISSLKERLNVYGLGDVIVRAASDLSGNDFILIEIAGVTEEEVKELLSRQGKFEAKIANETVFFGGKKDITYVCRTADCSGIDFNSGGCGRFGDGYSCSFFFSISLSSQAAQRQADLTRNLAVVSEGPNDYLEEDLILILDDVEVDTLRIGSSLKGIKTTNIQISGSGSGRTEQEAITNTLQEMKKLQTIIITGSLPVKLDVVKLDTISPSLGKEFLDNILLVGFLAIGAVIVVVFARYRKIKIVIPMVFIIVSEIILILGFAALVGWNLDLASIAGIIIVAGTGVDHLIVITDETIQGSSVTDWKRRLKNAMFIVFGAYLTTVSGMLPLLWAGAGLLKGFALTTIAGISFGVLIARPAFAVIIEKLLKD
jgi:preprotein translocase subunit SecD